MNTKELIKKLECVKYSRDREFIFSTIDEVVEMLSAGVEIFGSTNYWGTLDNEFIKDPTSKALLINIQPIKKETREEKLESIVKDFVDNIFSNEMPFDGVKNLYDKAKALLDEK